MRNKHGVCLGVLAASLLAACGGGGGDGSSVAESSAAGFYDGTTSDNRVITGAVMPNGTYYVLYSASGSPSTIGGFVQGTATASNGSFSSSDGRDFNFEGAGTFDVSVSASYRTKSSLSGTVSAGGQSSSFSSTYNAEYEKTPSLDVLAGTYNGITQDATGTGSATVQVATNGTVTGSTNTGCDIDGVVEPAAEGNAYALGITFSGGSCPVAGLSLSGAAFFDSIHKELYAAAFDAPRSYGTVFIGAKP